MDIIMLLMLLFVIIIAVFIAVMAATNRIIFKMAVRNFSRRKLQSLTVICGLMIGTAIISSSLAVQDTMVYMSEVDVYRSLGEVDEEIWGLNSFGTVEYFNESIYETLAENLSSVDGIEAVAPVISDLGAVFDKTTELGDPFVAILGLDSEVLKTTSFGDLDGDHFYPDLLGPDEVAINSRLADEIDALEGHVINLSYGARNPLNPFEPELRVTNFTITKIIQEEDLWGKANYNLRKTVFLEIDTLQLMLNRPGEINYIWISNDGDYRSGESLTKKVNKTIESELELAVNRDNDLTGRNLVLEVHNVKADNLEAARVGAESIGIMFFILGSFAIIAGIVLIINIFVMLGEERKSEMGMARAVGMKSKHLVRMYVFEGSLYAFVAAFIGVFLGLFFGWIIIQAFEYIFGSSEGFVEGASNIQFYFTWGSVIIAFCAGLLLTFATIFLISTRITKLNIIRAIRRIPEPRTSGTKKRSHIMGAVLAILGILSCFIGYSTDAGAGWMLGLPFLFIGSALVIYKWIRFRVAITVASILIIFFLISPFDIPVISEADYSGAESFILGGVFLVLAGVFLVMFNSDILLIMLQRLFSWDKTSRAVFKTAISYPMASKMKTGMTLGMFALIIFTVTVIAMFSSILASQSDAMLEEQSGGYDIMGTTNPRTPFENLSMDTLPSELQDYDIKQLETITSAVVTVEEYDVTKSEGNDFVVPGTMKVEQYQLLGASDAFLSNNGFTLIERDDRYETDGDAWEALSENSSYCIIDGTKLGYMEGDVDPSETIDIVGAFVGGTITITDMGGSNRTRVLTVIGIMDQMFFFQGILVQKDVVRNEYGGVDSLVLIELGEGEDTDTVAKAFEKHYLELGLQTSDLAGIINSFISLFNNMLYLMEGFLGIGLLVGIAGIGIISYRNVIERRQQIGMLRAIGFKRRMIAKSFLIETSFITILGILIGIALGIGVGYQMYVDFYKEEGSRFVIPWLNLIAISVIAYLATIIFTFYPSVQAAKIPPAEALRYIE
ncbi:MAG: FtsX-like permease family protein [Thermoplasmata archaeon]|nr:MAG: FtsX-like permease family protein [Thermoplasmata archaeon]